MRKKRFAPFLKIKGKYGAVWGFKERYREWIPERRNFKGLLFILEYINVRTRYL